jgi:hypothetical protein
MSATADVDGTSMKKRATGLRQVTAKSDRGANLSPDGRRMRAIRTARSIVEAYVSLIREKHTRPAVAELAETARCSVRSVYERFGSLGELDRATFDYVLKRLAEPPPTLLPEGDRHNRIRSHVRTRAVACETWLPVWQVLRGDYGSQALQSSIERMCQLTREQLELVYRPELECLTAHRRQTILIALEALTDFESWGRMREHYKLSVDEACSVWSEVIDQLLRE